MRASKEEIIVKELEKTSGKPIWLRELARRCQLEPAHVSHYLKGKLNGVVSIEKRHVEGQRDLVFVSLKRVRQHEA